MIAHYTFPQVNITNCIALICDGDMDYGKEITQRIKECSRTIAVNGGLSHCVNMNIEPDWIVGECLTVSPSQRQI